MRILAVTNMYPTDRAPHSGVFVEQQVKALRRIGLSVSLLEVKRIERGVVCYLGLRKQIQDSLENIQPDIVHIMYGGVMADIVTRTVKDRPVVVTFHGSDLLGEHLSGQLRQVIAQYGVWASWRAARRACSIVTVSEALCEALPDDIRKAKVRVIPCGIDLKRFKPLDRQECQQQLGWNRTKFHVIFPSNGGDPVKRFNLAQAAVHTLNRLGINTEMHELRGVENTQVPIWMNASDVLLLTSLHEGSPTVVKEALACNLPVISVDVGDVAERIRGIEGCYLALPNSDDLSAKLALVHSGGRRVAGRSKIWELSLERIARQLKRLYEDVLKEPERKREIDN